MDPLYGKQTHNILVKQKQALMLSPAHYLLTPLPSPPTVPPTLDLAGGGEVVAGERIYTKSELQVCALLFLQRSMHPAGGGRRWCTGSSCDGSSPATLQSGQERHSHSPQVWLQWQTQWLSCYSRLLRESAKASEAVRCSQAGLHKPDSDSFPGLPMVINKFTLKFKLL